MNPACIGFSRDWYDCELPIVGEHWKNKCSQAWKVFPENRKMGPFSYVPPGLWFLSCAIPGFRPPRRTSPWANFLRSLRELRSCSSDLGACPKEVSGESYMELSSTPNNEN